MTTGPTDLKYDTMHENVDKEKQTVINKELAKNISTFKYKIEE
jgi:hypothetical protein